jgi:hypothetical protein
LIDSFLGGAAIRFLGVSDATRQNRGRLIERISELAPTTVPPSALAVLGLDSWPPPAG